MKNLQQMAEKAKKDLETLAAIVRDNGTKPDVIETALMNAYSLGHFDGLVQASKVEA